MAILIGSREIMMRISMLITTIYLLSFLKGCEIDFEPDVVPLELETISTAQGPEELVPKTLNLRKMNFKKVEDNRNRSGQSSP